MSHMSHGQISMKKDDMSLKAATWFCMTHRGPSAGFTTLLFTQNHLINEGALVCSDNPLFGSIIKSHCSKNALQINNAQLL